MRLMMGRDYHAPGCAYNPPLPRHARIVYIDTCKLRWCSVGSVASHSFAWPCNAREAKSIARTLLINHCNWADVLIVRGRCFSTNKVCFMANRPLEDLLWNWSNMGQPYVVYREGSAGIGGGDLVPAWLVGGCFCKGCCQCNLVRRQHQGWHHPGALCSNIVSRRPQLFERHCGYYHVRWPFLNGCNRNITIF